MRRGVGIGKLLVIGLILAVIGSGTAEAASVGLSWTAPTTNADGTPLSDLAGYRVYLATSPPDCPGPSFFSVPSSTTAPSSGQTVSTRVTSLTVGTTYFASISALDTSGNESECSPTVSGAAQADFTVAPSGSTAFGNVAVGAVLDRTFTVQNTTSATLSGGATGSAPFRIVSGGSFTLASGASQTVTVRFQPTAPGTFASNVAFTVGSDTISRAVSGSSGAGTGTTPPPSSSPPPMPASVSATQLTADTTGVTFTVSWSAAAGATSYRYTAAFNDGTASKEGSVTGLLSFPLVMPYHSSGEATGGFVCIRSVDGAGQQSTDQACTALNVPAPSGPDPKKPPVPVLSSLSPASATAGTAALTLTVNGSGFVSSSVVHWNGSARNTTFVGATQLGAAISAADLATAGSFAVSVVTPPPGGGTSGNVTFAVTGESMPPLPSTPLPAPTSPTVTPGASRSSGVTFTIAWGAASGATSYSYTAAFEDGSASQQGSVSGSSLQLQMPYHVSGAAFGAFVCVRSVNAAGQQSAEPSCNAFQVPAGP